MFLSIITHKKAKIYNNSLLIRSQHQQCRSNHPGPSVCHQVHKFQEKLTTSMTPEVARLRSFISSVILPSSLSYVPCRPAVLKFRVLDQFPGRNVAGIFYSRNFLNWVLTTLFHPLANV